MAFVAAAVNAVAGWVATTWIGSVALNLGASLLLGAAAKALMPQAEQRLNPRTFTTRNPVTPRDLVYGEARKGGAVVFINEDGTDNSILEIIVVLAGHRVQNIGRVYFDGQLAAEIGQSQLVGRWNGRGFVQRFLGNDDQPATDAILDPAWTPNHRLRGCAYIVVRMAYDIEDPQGIPNVSADVVGKNDIFDPRDSQFKYTTNPALCLADYMAWDRKRGGLGIPYSADGIDTADLVEAANICDEIVATPGGGTEPRYSCHGVLMLSSDTTPQDRIRALLTSMAGSITDTAPYRIRAGAYRTPEFNFGLDDLRGPISVQALETGDQICNGARGVFVSPTNDWQPDDFPAVQSAVYLAEDEGVETWHDLNLPFTISPGMAQRIAKIDLERTRRQVTVTLTGSAKWLCVQPGDVVNLTIGRYGWSAKPFEVRKLTARFEENAILVDAVLRETSPLVYTWDATEAQIYAAAPKTNLPEPWNVPAPGFISVSESLYTTRAGVRSMATLTWVAAPSAYVAEYRVRALPPGGNWRDVGTTRSLTMDVLDTAPGVWTFEVRAVASLGSVGPPVTRQVELAGLSTPPAALSGLTVQQAGGLAILQWTQAPELDVREGGQILIRHSPAQFGAEWSSSRGIGSVPGASTLAVVALMPGTYFVRPIDSTGNLGPVSQASTDGIQVIAFSPAGSLQEDDEFSGAKSGVYLDTISATPGILLGDTGNFDDVTDVDALLSFDWTDAIVRASGTYEFTSGLNLTTAKRVRLRTQIALDAYNPFDDFDARLGLVDGWLNFDGADGGEVNAWIEVRTTTDDPTGSPTWSDWRRVDATEVMAHGIEARAQLTTSDNGITPFVSQLRLYADEVSP